MADAEGVMVAFAALREAGDAAAHAQPAMPSRRRPVRTLCGSTGGRRPRPGGHPGLEDSVQGDGQFDGAEVGRQVAAGLRYRFDQEARSSVASCGSCAVQSAQVGRDVMVSSRE